mmetsp:Transcript_32053/g.55291  ORF Transcript_32053/g.55291 Transcript_32053/m.55291 type:complete len:117 (-) Transcript_32053:3024-3374(-)
MQLFEISTYLNIMTTFEEASNGESWFILNAWRLTLIIIGVVLTGLIGTLFTVHTCLVSKNMTTWEFFSWRKITYLHPWGRTSPFDKGIYSNFKLFFQLTTMPELYAWTLPTVTTHA